MLFQILSDIIPLMHALDTVLLEVNDMIREIHDEKIKIIFLASIPRTRETSVANSHQN